LREYLDFTHRPFIAVGCCGVEASDTILSSSSSSCCCILFFLYSTWKPSHLLLFLNQRNRSWLLLPWRALAKNRTLCGDHPLQCYREGEGEISSLLSPLSTCSQQALLFSLSLCFPLALYSAFLVAVQSHVKSICAVRYFIITNRNYMCIMDNK
jgi:hypothetical protein